MRAKPSVVGVRARSVRRASALVVLLLCVLALGRPQSAAWPPSLGSAPTEVHVAGADSAARDDNPGTSSRPVKTIARGAAIAAATNAKGEPVRVIIHPGIYREAVDLRAETPAPITFEAADNGTVIVSGSEIWNGWEFWRPGGYRHVWPYRWGMVALPPRWPSVQDITRRREMVFINGQPLAQALSPDGLEEGHFAVDEAAGWIYVVPRAGTDMQAARVEVAVRPALFKASHANLTLRGLTFQNAATFLDGAAVNISEAPAALVEDTSYLWNNWGGLDIQASTNVVVRRSVANHNGGRGMSDWRNKDILFEDTETSYNNWRGAAGGFFDWAMGGIKTLRAHGGTWRRHKSLGNQAYGLWFDSDNEDIVVEDSVLCDNRLPGLFLEASQGPIRVTRSTMCNNDRDGVYANGAARVTLEDNAFIQNGGAQIELGGIEVRSGVDNWETRQVSDLRDERWTICGNVVVGRPPDGKDPGWTLSVPKWPWFLDTLRSSNNMWWNARSTGVFRFAGAQDLTLREWQRLTKQDNGSVFADPKLSLPDQRAPAGVLGVPAGHC